LTDFEMKVLSAFFAVGTEFSKYHVDGVQVSKRK
jgi:hypothetical protein